MSTALRSINLLVAFLLELALLAALGYWGFHVGDNMALKILLGIGAPLLVAVFWGLLLAPRALVHVKEPLHLLLATAVFAIGVAALVAAGRPAWGWALGALFVINQLLLHIWK